MTEAQQSQMQLDVIFCSTVISACQKCEVWNLGSGCEGIKWSRDDRCGTSLASMINLWLVFYWALILSNEEFAARSMVDRGCFWLCPRDPDPFIFNPSAHQPIRTKQLGRSGHVLWWCSTSFRPCHVIWWPTMPPSPPARPVGLALGWGCVGQEWVHTMKRGFWCGTLWSWHVLAMVGVMIHAYKGLAKHTGPGAVTMISLVDVYVGPT